MQMMERSLTGSTFFIPLLPDNHHHPVFSLKTPLLLHILYPPPSSSSMLQLLHSVEGGACLEPFDLRLVEAVNEFKGLLAAVTVLHDCLKRLGRTRGRGRKIDIFIPDAFHQQLWRSPFSDVMPSYLSWSEGFESCDGDLVIRADLVVV